MEIRFEQSHFIPSDPATVFATAVLDVSFLERAVEKFGPLPNVIKCEIVHGKHVAEGAIRRVTLKSGGILNERIKKCEIGPAIYRMNYVQETGFPFPFSLVSKAAHGEYVACPSQRGTLFTWRSTHILASPISFPLAWLLRALFVHPMMHRFLKNTEKEVYNVK